MRLSDALLGKQGTERIYLNHRLPRWLTEDALRSTLEPLVRRQSPPQLIPEPGPRNSMLYE